MDILFEIIGTILYMGMFLSFAIGLWFLIDWICNRRKRYGIATLVCGAVLVTCTWFVGHASYKLEREAWSRPDPYVTHTVMAMQDGNEINGSIRGRKYSMSGYINEEFMYVYGYKTVGGGMKIQKVSAKNATVYFNDRVAPNAKWYKETREFWWLEEERYTCDIFIPTDSLQAELVIDLQ